MFQTVYAATTGNPQDIASGTTLQLVNLLELVITKIPLWIAAFIVILLSFFVAKILRNIVENKLAESGLEEEHKELQTLGGRITSATVQVIGATVGLKIAGIDLTTIIAAVGFGIGFALKDLIMNFLAGVLIILGRQFTVGDFIKIGGILGKVMEIQSRVTILRGIDGAKVIVPNADIFSKQVTSYTSNPFRRLEVIVGVDYRNDLANAVKVCMEALKHTKGILVEPKPVVIVSEFADSSINLKIRGWVDSHSAWLKTKSKLIVNIQEKFAEYGITIPWPIRTIAYDKDSPINEKMMKEEKEEKAIGEAIAKDLPAAKTITVKKNDDEQEPPLKPLAERR